MCAPAPMHHCQAPGVSTAALPFDGTSGDNITVRRLNGQRQSGTAARRHSGTCLRHAPWQRAITPFPVPRWGILAKVRGITLAAQRPVHL